MRIQLFGDLSNGFGFFGTGIVVNISKKKCYLQVFEGGHTFLPGLVISRDVFDIRLFGSAWIWNRGRGWEHRLTTKQSIQQSLHLYHLKFCRYSEECEKNRSIILK